jgi:hypothetical protein
MNIIQGFGKACGPHRYEEAQSGDDVNRIALVVVLIVLLLASGVVFGQTSGSSASDTRVNRRCPDATLGTDPAAPCAGEVLNDWSQQPAQRIVAPPNAGLSVSESNRAPNQSMVTPPDPSSSTVQILPSGSTSLQTDRAAPTTLR